MSAVALSREAWLEERKTYLGATDIGAILGLNPYVSPHDVWLAKHDRLHVEEKIVMRAGTHLEPFIAEEFTRATGHETRPSKTYRHPVYPFCASNPDREFTLDEHRALLECKSVGAWASKNFGNDGSDQIPKHYLMQCLWQLITSGADVVVLAALIDCRELRTFYYSLNPNLSSTAHIFPREEAKRVFTYAVKWWEKHIVKGEEPELTGAESDTDYTTRERATFENGQKAYADVATDRECVLLRSAIKRAERANLAVEGRKNRIKQFMATEKISELETTAGLFTWKTNAKGVAVFKTPFTSNKA